MTVAENIVIQNSAALHGKILVYNAWITDRFANDVDISTFHQFMKPPIINQLKSQLELSYIRDLHTTIIYKYFDKAGNYITEIIISPEEYSDWSGKWLYENNPCVRSSPNYQNLDKCC